MPKEIPVMPDIVLISKIRAPLQDSVIVGLSADSIAPVGIGLDNRVVLISGVEQSGKTNLLRAISKQLSKSLAVCFVSATNDENIDGMILSALRKVESGESVALLIDDLPSWLASAKNEDTDLLESLIRNARSNTLTFYATGDAGEITGEDGVPDPAQQGNSSERYHYRRGGTARLEYV